MTDGPHTNDASIAIPIAGLAYRVRITGRSNAQDDPLLRAVVELVDVGYRTVDSVIDALRPLHQHLVRGALEHGLLLGRVGLDEQGFLFVAPLAEREHTEQIDGVAIWSLIEHRALPCVLVSDPSSGPMLRTGKGLPGAMLPLPRRRDVRDAILREAHLGNLQLLRPLPADGVPAMEGPPYEELDALIDEIVLVDEAPARRVELRCRVSVASALFDGEPRFQRASLAGLESEAPMWVDAYERLRTLEDGASALREIDDVTARLRYERLGSIGGKKPDELVRDVEHALEWTKGARIPEDWRSDELLARARAALIAEPLQRHVQGTSERRHLAVAREWAAVLELITRRLGDEVAPVLGARWMTLPRSRAEAATAIDELAIDLGPTRERLLQRWDGKPKDDEDIGTKLRSELGAFVAVADGKRSGRRDLRSGCGELLLLWAFALLINEQGRTQHAERVRAALAADPKLFSTFAELIKWRNDAVHVNPVEPPHPKLVAQRTLAVWKVLATTAPVGRGGSGG